MIMKYVNKVEKKEAYDIIYTVMIMKYVNTVEKKRSTVMIMKYVNTVKKKHCDDYEICEHS